MDDLISRHEAIDALCDNCDNVQAVCAHYPCKQYKAIEVLPSAQPERKKGHYIGEADGYADGELVYDIWSCSECGCYFEDWDEQPTYNFCPNCGADMRGEANDNWIC